MKKEQTTKVQNILSKIFTEIYHLQETIFENKNQYLKQFRNWIKLGTDV